MENNNLFSEEDFDGEYWDQYAPEIVKMLGVESYAEWLDIMTPLWQHQITKVIYLDRKTNDQRA